MINIQVLYQYKEEKFWFGTEFQKNNSTEVEKVINNLIIVKVCQKDVIPTKAIKMNEDIFACFIAKDFNNCRWRCISRWLKACWCYTNSKKERQKW